MSPPKTFAMMSNTARPRREIEVSHDARHRDREHGSERREQRSTNFGDCISYRLRRGLGSLLAALQCLARRDLAWGFLDVCDNSVELGGIAVLEDRLNTRGDSLPALDPPGPALGGSL